MLSSGSRAAKFEDLRHTKDDGVYKQGYLITESSFFGSRTRKWFRLYSTKLYQVDLETNSFDDSLACGFQVLTDVSNATIAAKAGGGGVGGGGGAWASSAPAPFWFVISAENGTSLEFQAENEDEMMQVRVGFR